MTEMSGQEFDPAPFFLKTDTKTKRSEKPLKDLTC
jgi:hypothetical protein